MNETTPPDDSHPHTSMHPNDEIGSLRDIITPQEKQAYTVMALTAALLTGLGTLTFSWRSGLTPRNVITIGFLAIASFGFWALSHPVIAARCIGVCVKSKLLLSDVQNIRGLNASRPLEDIPFDLWLKASKDRTNSILNAIAAVAVVLMAFPAARPHQPPSGFAPQFVNVVAILTAQSNVTVSLNILSVNSDIATVTTRVPSRRCDIELAKGTRKSVAL